MKSNKCRRFVSALFEVVTVVGVGWRIAMKNVSFVNWLCWN